MNKRREKDSNEKHNYDSLSSMSRLQVRYSSPQQASFLMGTCIILMFSHCSCVLFRRHNVSLNWTQCTCAHAQQSHQGCCTTSSELSLPSLLGTSSLAVAAGGDGDGNGGGRMWQLPWWPWDNSFGGSSRHSCLKQNNCTKLVVCLFVCLFVCLLFLLW